MDYSFSFIPIPSFCHYKQLPKLLSPDYPTPCYVLTNIHLMTPTTKVLAFYRGDQGQTLHSCRTPGGTIHIALQMVPSEVPPNCPPLFGWQSGKSWSWFQSPNLTMVPLLEVTLGKQLNSLIILIFGTTAKIKLGKLTQELYLWSVTRQKCLDCLQRKIWLEIFCHVNSGLNTTSSFTDKWLFLTIFHR